MCFLNPERSLDKFFLFGLQVIFCYNKFFYRNKRTLNFVVSLFWIMWLSQLINYQEDSFPISKRCIRICSLKQYNPLPTCNDIMTLTESYNPSNSIGSPTSSGGIISNKRQHWNTNIVIRKEQWFFMV